MERRLAALAEAPAKIFAARSLDETLRLIGEAAREIVGANHAAIGLANGADGARAPLAGGLAAPLVDRDGATLGLIQLSDKSAGEFDEADKTALGQLAHLAGLAIENQRLIAAAQTAERRFEEFAKVGNEVLWETDAEHRYTLFLAKGSFRMRAAPNYFIGKTRWDAVGANRRDALWIGHIADLDAHRPIRGFEYPTAMGDGRVHQLRLNAEPLFGQAGVFIGYRGTTQDITDLRDAEAAAKASEARFHEFAKLGSDVLWETDENHLCTFISARADWKMRHPLSWFVGKTRWDAIGANASDPAWRAHIAELDAHQPIRGFEFSWLLEDGTLRYLRVNGRPRFDDNGKFLGYRGATTDVSAARRAEALARANEDRFRDFAERASDWLWETGPDNTFTYVSPPRDSVSRFKVENVLGRTRWNLAGADPSDPKWAAHIADLAARRPFRDFEYTFAMPDGSARYNRVSGRPVFAADGAFLGYRGTTTDISAEREAAAQARKAAEQYKHIVETANEGLWLFDCEMRIEFANRRASELLGYPPEELIGRPLIEFVPADRRTEVQQHWKQRATGKSARFEARYVRKDGGEIWVLVSATPRFDAAGAFAGATSMFVDISDRKRAEAAMRLSEERYRNIVETANEGVWILDADARTVFANRPMAEMLGHTPESLLGRSVYEFRDPSERTRQTDQWAERKKGVAAQRELHFLRRDGTKFWGLLNAQPMRDAAGNFSGSLGMVSDITARKEAEDALRASEDRFRDFAEMGSDWVWETDAEHRLTTLHGPASVARGFALGKRRWEYGGADPEAPQWLKHRDDVANRRPFRKFEYALIGSAGEQRYFSISGKPVYDPAGTFIGYRGTTTDITALRDAEAAVRESERKYRHIVEMAYEGIWMLDVERRTTYVNPRMAEMLGYAADEMLGRHHWEFMDAADREAAIEATRQRPNDGVERAELRYRRRDGSPIWLIVTSNVIDDEATGTQAVLGMVTDITDRKAAEERAARAKHEVDAILTSISDGFVAVDNEWRFTYVNAAAERIVGRSAAELIGRPVVSMVKGGADNVFGQSYQAAKRENEPAFFTAYSDTLDLWMEVRAYPHADGLTIFFRDVTAERRSHFALAESERKFRQIVETANEGLWITDREGKIVFANRRLEELLGYDPGELVGKSVFDTVPPDRLDEVRWHRGESRSGRAGRFEARHLRKDGSEITMLLSLTPTYDGAGAFVGSFVMFVDISEQRRVKAALEDSERKLRAALESNQSILASVSDGFVALDNEWRFTFINAAAERMWNLKAADLIGKTAFDTMKIDASNPFIANYLASKQSGEPVAFVAHSEIFGKWLEVRGYPHAGGFTMFFDDVTEERRAHRTLIENQKKLEAAREMNERIFETSLDLICITDRQGDFIQVNPGAYEQFGYVEDELIGHNASEFIDEGGIATTRQAMRDARSSRRQHTFENHCRRKDGKLISMNWSVAWSEQGQNYFLIGRDMTERVQAEERLNRSQRLEAIGQLTGGIAHDFNNLLTVIMGNSDALAQGLKDHDKLRRRAELSLEAARRAAELTAQLLAFARRQTLAPNVVAVNKLIRDLYELMQCSLGAQIEIDVVPGPDLWNCRVDSAQLETALLNLAVNARDAMPQGGRLCVCTSNRHIAGPCNGDGNGNGSGSGGELAAGDYVVIEVCDTGVGMTPAVLARAFEPFFTTKDIGKGSGLGLAMVYGFVKQSGGHVAIESEPSRGTKVTLYLPRAAEAAAAAAPAPAADNAPLPGGKETILVVEDDAAVRELVTDQLRTLGYRVLVAGNGPTARNILFGGDKVDLLFTDVMMPGGVTGTQLAAEAERELPGLKVLFTTGYADLPALKGSRQSVSLLRKPYKTRDLALTVRRALDVAA